LKSSLFALAVELLLAAMASAADPSRSVVHVETRVGDVKHCGTGTVVACEGGKSLVLTNEHVVRANPRGARVWHEDFTYSTRLVAVSDRPDVDLALLEVDHELPAAAIGGEPTGGERVTVYGYGPDQRRMTRREGTVVGQVGWSFVTPTLALSFPCVHGDSGAGVFNARGELVGVVHSTWDGRPGSSAVPVRVTASWTTEVTVTREALFPRFRAAVGKLAGALAPKPMPPAKAEAAPAPKPKEAPEAPAVPAPKAVPAAPAPAALYPSCAGGRCPPAAQYQRRGLGLLRR
jgi:hypothetical protein